LGEEAGWREGFLFGLKKGGQFPVSVLESLLSFQFDHLISSPAFGSSCS
jgi:hypothetical protein